MKTMTLNKPVVVNGKFYKAGTKVVAESFDDGFYELDDDMFIADDPIADPVVEEPACNCPDCLGEGEDEFFDDPELAEIEAMRLSRLERLRAMKKEEDEKEDDAEKKEEEGDEDKKDDEKEEEAEDDKEADKKEEEEDDVEEKKAKRVKRLNAIKKMIDENDPDNFNASMGAAETTVPYTEETEDDETDPVEEAIKAYEKKIEALKALRK